MKKKKENKFMFYLIIYIAITLAIFTAFFASTFVFYSQPSNCDSEINESFFNGTQAGYQLGVMDAGNYVLQTGQLPVFINESVGFQYLNLSKVFG